VDEPASPTRRNFLTGRFGEPDLASDGVDPGPRYAVVGDGCLARRGVDCQVCRDACPEAAIRFRPRRGGPFLPEVIAAVCTGCGDCGPPCPTAAIRFEPVEESADA
jgi:NAD-dependent dihydropyrimidine dehydrogenase PreA subunit